MSRYRFIEVQRGQYPVRLLCQVVGVPASGYYAWQQAQQQRKKQIAPAWEAALVKVFVYHKRRYGTRRLQVALRQKGYQVGRQRLHTAMRRRALHALQPKAYTPRTTDSTHGLRCAPNRLLDQPKPTQANRVWVSDSSTCRWSMGTGCTCARTKTWPVSRCRAGRWGFDAEGAYYQCLAARFLGATAHTRLARPLRPGWAVLRQRLPAVAPRPRGRAFAEPARRLLR